MALILSLREGEQFCVGGIPVEVPCIYSDRHFTVQTEDGKEFDVTDDKMVEVMPDVYVSVGAQYDEGLARVAIEAPRDILILREKHFKEAGN